MVGNFAESQSPQNLSNRLSSGDAALPCNHGQEDGQHGHCGNRELEQVAYGGSRKDCSEMDHQQWWSMLCGEAQRTEYLLTGRRRNAQHALLRIFVVDLHRLFGANYP